MSYKITALPQFSKELKKLSKKYASLKQDLSQLVDILREEPQTETPLAHNCYKIRLAISSKGKGKSGGARVITYFAIQKDHLILLSIYDKSDKDSISEQRILQLLANIED